LKNFGPHVYEIDVATNTMPFLTRETPNPEPIDCRVLTSALKLFVNDGYHKVSIHDIQKDANVSIGSIYKHFGGKEGIAKALYLHLLNEINEMIDTVLDQDLSAIGKCNLVIQLLFEYTETRTDIIAFVLHAKHAEFITDQAPICDAEPFQKLRDIVQQGMDSGEIKTFDKSIATSAIFGGAIRMIQLRLEGVIPRPLPELYDQLIQTIWNGMAKSV
jgi:TetR/AcrR family transcriptional regulator, repressor of fatR-cypB operon